MNEIVVICDDETREQTMNCELTNFSYTKVIGAATMLQLQIRRYTSNNKRK